MWLSGNGYYHLQKRSENMIAIMFAIIHLLAQIVHTVVG